MSIINSECWGTFTITLKNVCEALVQLIYADILRTK